MDITIHPSALHGQIQIIPSKSQAHRLLICAAFANDRTTLICPETNRDIEATASCLNALGAVIERTPEGYHITPVSGIAKTATLDCGESGSTLRFLLPVVGALGVDATFQMHGRLPQRPLSPLWEEMTRMGCILTRPTGNTIHCCGKLQTGEYVIDGGVSSQFITGLLFANALMGGQSQITVTGTLESKPYVDMTHHALAMFHAPQWNTPGQLEVEGDWSNGAFFLAARSLGSRLTVHGLNPQSPQGDKAILPILTLLETGTPTLCARDIPDLIPVLSVVAAMKNGAVFTDIRRLRLKESDRVASIVQLINNLGGKAHADANSLTVLATGLLGGTVDAVNDHRIAMSAAIAATVCQKDVTISGAECVNKSYPRFWEEYTRLGGNYEFNIR